MVIVIVKMIVSSSFCKLDKVMSNAKQTCCYLNFLSQIVVP